MSWLLYQLVYNLACLVAPGGAWMGCFRCQSYGHGTASCSDVAICNKCSSTEHASEACATERRKCANCKGEHAAYSKTCPKWQKEKEIQRIKVLENISYSEAKKRVVNILPPRASTSYANAVMTNTKSKKDNSTQTDIGTQTEISNIETPTNIANLTSESHTDSPIARKSIANNLIEQETILSLPETSSTDLESLNIDKRFSETSHLPVPSDAEVLMEIDKSSLSNGQLLTLSKAAVAEWYRHRIVAGFVTSSSAVPLKTRRVGQRCTLNLSRAETSSRWCGVVVRERGCQLRCRPRHLTMVQNYVVRPQKPSCS
ncbi:uncharacterized protein TNCV_2127051 [Trichonephila clavipes]|nr:uncharacterized protein TNCV_2127051 [Trichonephila clavipes]